MPYTRQIAILIKRFGQSVQVVSSDGMVQEVSALIQPVKYKAKNYLETEVSSLGIIDEGVYFYIGPPSVKIPKFGEKYEVKTNDSIYDILRSEMVTVGGEEIYCWAVLKQRYEDGEVEI